MPNITLYVKDSDLPSINQAKAKLGNSLSAVFVDCIRERLNRKEPSGKMEKITLAFWNESEDPVIKKSFTGRWLVGSAEDGLRADDDYQSWDAGAEWAVAQTQKGSIVTYVRHCNDGWAPKMEVYESFDDFKDAKDSSGETNSNPQNVIAAAAAELGQPYEIEMDI